MLNATDVILYIETELGYKFTELEVDHNDVLKYIRRFTLPVWSKFYPFQQRIMLRDCPLAEGFQNAYHLICDLPIMSVARVMTNNSDYIDPSIITRNTFYNQDVFAGQISVDTISMMKNPVTFKYNTEYNTLEIYPLSTVYEDAMIICNCVHPDSFATIPENLQEYFLELVTYDVKNMLYQMRHRFANLQTVYGDIELFIDDLSEAKNNKKELLEVLRRNAYKHKSRRKLYTTLDN